MHRIRVLVAACALACATWSAHSPAPVRAAWVPYGYVDVYVLRYPQSAWAIARAAAAYRQSYRDMLAVAECESGLQPWVVNTWSGAEGLYQFMPATWLSFSWRAGMGGGSPFNPVQAAWVTAWAFAHGLRGHWSCA
jgi:soluble lytic murein transglycosylase-like protein